eukprot:2972959-Amphidinium_carterae.1
MSSSTGGLGGILENSSEATNGNTRYECAQQQRERERQTGREAFPATILSTSLDVVCLGEQEQAA